MKKEARKEQLVWSPESQRVYTLRTIERASAKNRPTLRAFSEWLEARGLAQATITILLGSVKTFVEAVATRRRSCAGALRALSADGVEGFWIRYGRGHGMAARRHMRTGIRSFLKFAASHGWVGGDLADAVPSLVGCRLSGLPHAISDEQLATLLRSPWVRGECIRRDRAVVYLLATYGVRRQQVSALQLADVDWHEKTIDFIAHKGGKAVRHILTQAVADSLADYLRNERPISDSYYVFLRQTPPYLRLSPLAISSMVRARMEYCGLPPRGPHAFRHAFATRLLRAGQPVKAISDLLGHRSLDAVAIYAKVDRDRLLESAVEWPEVAS